MILSWLTFSAAVPALDEVGLDGLVYPDLSQNPFYLLLASGSGGKVSPPVATTASPGRDLLTPSLPNTFTAFIPAGRADTLPGAVVKAVEDEWSLIETAVHDRLSKAWFGHPEWGRRWDAGWTEQVGNLWDIRAYAVPAVEAADGSPLWPESQRVAQRLMEAQKRLRPVWPPVGPGDTRPKCTLMGTFPQMGPIAFGDEDPSELSARFWDWAAANTSLEGTRVRSGERLSAMALIKRFAWPAYFAGRFGRNPADMRLDDTSTVAARSWLAEIKLRPETVRAEHHGKWEGLWLRSRDKVSDDASELKECPVEVRDAIEAGAQEHGPPPSYYATLAMDGDHMGLTFLALDQAEDHRALSRAIAAFAQGDVPPEVESHARGLVYAGGDDLLTLLPLDKALDCAREIANRFDKRVGSLDFLERAGLHPTMSAGLAVAHFRSDMRTAIGEARQAEASAKRTGRNRLAISVLKRSGVPLRVVLPWTTVPALQNLVKEFARGSSDRWLYQLARELPSLPKRRPTASAGPQVPGAGDRDPLRSELVRLLVRSEGWPKKKPAAPSERSRLRDNDPALALFDEAPGAGFVDLALVATFLAKGRDA
jgi:CRISPR-associated protein Cmr2